MHRMEESLNETVIVEDMSSLSGTGEIVGPYLDMVCMSSSESYRDAILFIIVDHVSQQFRGIIKIEYNSKQHQKYLYFSGFEELSKESLHYVVKDLNRHAYDFKVFRSRGDTDSDKSYKRLVATKFIGISYPNYQQLLLREEAEITLNFDNPAGGENDLIG